jgi:hypothetical protein
LSLAVANRLWMAAAMPPSMTAGGINAAVTVWQGRHAYCGRMW